MAKRSKRLKASIKSYKNEIDKHFQKLDNDIIEKDDILTRYHIKEIDKSLIAALEHKINLLDESANEADLKKYKNKLEEYKKKFGMM